MSTPDTATVDEPLWAYIARENARERGHEPVADATSGVIPDEQPVDLQTEAETPDETGKSETQPRKEDGKFAAKDAPKEEPKVGDPRRSHQAKINLAIAGQREAERRAADLEARLAALEQPKALPVARSGEPEPVAKASPKYVALIKAIEADPDCPQIEDFTDAGFTDPYAAYNAARSAFITERVNAEADAARSASQAEHRERELLTNIDTSGREKYQDWDALYASEAATKMVLTPSVLQELYADPDSSADLIHHLLTHPEDLETVARVPDDPIAAARTIARLAAGLTAAPSGPASVAKPQTKAKPLIKPVSASPVAPEPSNPEDLPFGPKYIQAMNAKERKAAMNR